MLLYHSCINKNIALALQYKRATGQQASSSFARPAAAQHGPDVDFSGGYSTPPILEMPDYRLPDPLED